MARISVKSAIEENSEKLYESFIKLVQVVQDDREIRTRVKEMLQMKSYQRRSVLNMWLEQLHARQAPECLLHALTCLFDDRIAEKVLDLIDNHHI